MQSGFVMPATRASIALSRMVFWHRCAATSSGAWFVVVVENDVSDRLSTVDNARHDPGCPQQKTPATLPENIFTQGGGAVLHAGSSSPASHAGSRNTIRRKWIRRGRRIALLFLCRSSGDRFCMRSTRKGNRQFAWMLTRTRCILAISSRTCSASRSRTCCNRIALGSPGRCRDP